MDDGALETDEDLWDSFIERFKLTFTNQNQKEEAYQKLCKLKQSESLDDFFAGFKQLANEAGVPLDDKGTIETLKHAMNKPLTRAVIQSPDYNPNAEIPWTFKKWEEQARQSHAKWQATTVMIYPNVSHPCRTPSLSLYPNLHLWPSNHYH